MVNAQYLPTAKLWDTAGRCWSPCDFSVRFASSAILLPLLGISLTNSESDASETEVFLFLKELVLNWLNAMSLMDLASKSIDIINILPSGLGVSRYLTCHVLATKGLSERHRYRISGVPAGC